jgi:hypothetical protein
LLEDDLEHEGFEILRPIPNLLAHPLATLPVNHPAMFVHGRAPVKA